MKLNEKGSTLILVMLVILVFSVLGVALMGNVVSEKKQVEKTESEMQARHLAQNGLTFFETEFKRYAGGDSPVTLSEVQQYLHNYSLKQTGNSDDGVEVKVEKVDDDTFNVISTGTVGSTEVTLKGQYDITYDTMDEEITKYTPEETEYRDFGSTTLVELGLWKILNLQLISIPGNDKSFYTVPDDSVIDADVLGIIRASIGDGERFRTVEENAVIASRQGELLSLRLFGDERNALVPLKLLDLLGVVEPKDVTNVLINGSFTSFELLWGLIKAVDYRDIEFKKFGVVGSCWIEQDRDGSKGLSGKDNSQNHRRFTFKEGLSVMYDLIIGSAPKESEAKDKVNDWKDYSKLMLRGDMVVGRNLYMNDVDLIIGDTDQNDAVLTENEKITNIYVQGEAVITDTCIRVKNGHSFGVFAEGPIRIENNTEKNIPNECKTLSGFFYSNDEIHLITHGKEMKINGGIQAKRIFVDGVEIKHPTKNNLKAANVIITEEGKLKNVVLTPVEKKVVRK